MIEFNQLMEVPMVLFYDPKDESDLARVERLLREAGIAYFLSDAPEPRLGPAQVLVAEEDFPTADALLGAEPQRRAAESSTVLPV
jgi:hypothetical protein